MYIYLSFISYIYISYLYISYIYQNIILISYIQSHSSWLTGVTQTMLGMFSTLSTISNLPVSRILNATIVFEAWFPTSRNCAVLSKLKCLGKAPKLSWMSTLESVPSFGSTLKIAIES